MKIRIQESAKDSARHKRGAGLPPGVPLAKISPCKHDGGKCNLYAASPRADLPCVAGTLRFSAFFGGSALTPTFMSRTQVIGLP